MDSLSQIVLGAAVGELTLGKKIGNKAQLIGAIAGTIPDLDILLNPFFTDEITKLQIHRSYSHSMFIHLLLAIPFAWLTYRIFKRKINFREWYGLWVLGFITHTLLDCCTTYGTQLLLPFTNYLIGFNNIAVVDPFWTIPFMLILIVCLFYKRENKNRMRWAIASVTYAMLYMGYTLINKYNVHQQFKAELERQHISYESLYTSPSMFNNWLWSGIAVSQDTIRFGEFSTLQENGEVKWVSYARHMELLDNHPASREIEVLQWFGQGKTFVREVNGEIHYFIGKWGRPDFTKTEEHDAFVFYWRIFKENEVWKAAPVEPDWGEGEFKEAWNSLWKRVKTSEGF
ncbi:MAG: metal-dependent hydrolase [Flavobacteriales bacterium]|nr:metal-dependent hydrolase [Flavobacteriales bacterium]